jgi:hypothetical protein
MRKSGRFRCRDKLFGAPAALWRIPWNHPCERAEGGGCIALDARKWPPFFARITFFCRRIPRSGTTPRGPRRGLRRAPGRALWCPVPASPAVQVYESRCRSGSGSSSQQSPSFSRDVARAEVVGDPGSRTRKNRAEGEHCPIVRELARGPGRRETLRTIIELLHEHSRVALARGLGYCAGARRPSSINSTRSRSPG